MTRKKSVSELKREAILDAAIQEFMENGFQGTNMDSIAARAQVSKRTVYNHFDSKEGLFETITRQLWRQGQEATDYDYQSAKPLAEQLTDIARQELDLLQSNGHIRLSAALMMEFTRSPELAQRAQSWMTQSESGLRRWVRAAMADGRLVEADAEFAASQFLGLIKTFTFWPQAIWHAPTPSPEEQDHIVQSAVDMFLGKYGCR